MYKLHFDNFLINEHDDGQDGRQVGRVYILSPSFSVFLSIMFRFVVNFCIGVFVRLLLRDKGTNRRIGYIRYERVNIQHKIISPMRVV